MLKENVGKEHRIFTNSNMKTKEGGKEVSYYSMRSQRKNRCYSMQNYTSDMMLVMLHAELQNFGDRHDCTVHVVR